MQSIPQLAQQHEGVREPSGRRLRATPLPPPAHQWQVIDLRGVHDMLRQIGDHRRVGYVAEMLVSPLSADAGVRDGGLGGRQPMAEPPCRAEDRHWEHAQDFGSLG
jgi:hypothetical protein